MAINDIVQTIAEARVDARSLSEFVFKPAGFKVARRLAPAVDTLQFYINRFDATKATADAYIATIPNIVNDAINNTAVEGGVLADTFVTVTVSSEGAIARTQRDKNSERISIEDFGAIADYAGTPLYDGNDSARITATDITTAFGKAVNHAITSGSGIVRIPSGHYAIKAGNLEFSGFKNLRIVGEGIGVSTLDFIAEDTTKTAYVSDAEAQCIAKFEFGESIEFSDLTIKATTKGGVVSGANSAATPDSVYYGAIWGFKIGNVKRVIFNSVRVERFNYRGMSIYGSQLASVTLNNCEGFNNAGSGFWQTHGELFINGGKFAYNGIKGNAGTGYGVTASAAVKTVIAKNAHFYRNYRKGLDTHGCSNFIVSNCTFSDNVLHHIAVANASVATDDAFVIIKNIVLNNGLLPDDAVWLTECYTELMNNGFNQSSNCMIAVGESGLAEGKIKSIEISNISCASNLNCVDNPSMLRNSPFFDLLANNAQLTISGCDLNFRGSSFVDNSDVYSHIMLNLITKSIDVRNNIIKLEKSSSYTNSATLEEDKAILFGLSNSSRSFSLVNNNITLYDSYIMAATAVGKKAAKNWDAAGVECFITDNRIKYTNLPFMDEDRLNSDFFFGKHKERTAIYVQERNILDTPKSTYSLKSGSLTEAYQVLPYTTRTSGYAIGARVLTLYADYTSDITVKVSTNDGSADLIIKIKTSDFIGSSNSDNAFLSFDRVAYIDTYGDRKMFIYVTAKVAINDILMGEVTYISSKPSLGLWRVEPTP